MRATATVSTPRLVGARPAPNDLDDLHGLLADERVAASLWPGRLGGPRTRDQAAGILARDIAHWEREGWGVWLFRDRAAARVRDRGRLVGRGGLDRTHVGGRAEVEVAYAVASARWGQGLATEITRVSVRVAFEELGLEDIVCFTLTSNHASRRVMEKAGFAFEREVQHAGLPHVLYRLRRPVA